MAMKLITPIPKLVTIGADELLEMDLPPVRMVVGDVIPAGLVLLAGDPKVGKSLLVQHLAISVALGEPAWGCFSIEEGDVLYFANEGGKRSFRQRLEKMTGSRKGLARLRVTETKESLGERLEAQIEDWLLNEANEPRLVIIDTYASVAPEGRGVNRHQDDYNSLAGLADLAARYQDTLFIVVHHTRKAEGDDVMHKISGSQGMTAATDGNIVMVRHTAARQAILSIRPRNAEEAELVMERDPLTLRWALVGDDERAQLSGGRQAILGWLDRHPKGGGPKAIAAATGIEYDSVRQYLLQMKGARQVITTSRGCYISAMHAEEQAVA